MCSFGIGIYVDAWRGSSSFEGGELTRQAWLVCKMDGPTRINYLRSDLVAT